MCAPAANSQKPRELLGGADQFKGYEPGYRDSCAMTPWVHWFASKRNR
jgi:hypothetical protein|tara:strand:- start:1620 stop:1763 length:144 start_codon:yes stop_codon:yes gene_type:complete